MDLLKENEFRKEIKTAPRAGYLFFGDEDYLKKAALEAAKEVLCPDPSLSFFNDLRLDAVGFEPSVLADALMPIPMMADRKLIALKGLNFNTMRPGEIDELCDVLATLPSYDYNVLIVSAAADCLDSGFLPKRPSPILTKLSEYLTPVFFERCTTAKLTAWIQRHFLHNGIDASLPFCREMTEYCGHEMFFLANEIDKLSFYLSACGKKEPNMEDARIVCTPATEYDAFAFTNAIMAGDSDAALSILADYRFRRVDSLMILGDVIRVICDMVGVRAMLADGQTAGEIASVLKIHEFRVGLYQKSLRNISEQRLSRALEACKIADASLKLSPQGYTALERLICSL